MYYNKYKVQRMKNKVISHICNAGNSTKDKFSTSRNSAMECKLSIVGTKRFVSNKIKKGN